MAEAKRGPGRPKKVTPVTEKPTVLAAPDAAEIDETYVASENDDFSEDEQNERVSDEPTMKDVVSALGKTVQALADATPRKVHYANHKPTSAFNPTGNKKRKLGRKFYQNGFLLDINKLTDEEIALLNKLPAGRFMDGLVSVLEVRKGQETAVNIVYDNSNQDKRFELKNYFRNFREMLKIILDESQGIKRAEA